MIRQILKQMKEYFNKHGVYPKCIYITKKQYKRLKKESSILEEYNDDIKLLYLSEFEFVEE